jgi:hypothetical protein
MFRFRVRLLPASFLILCHVPHATLLLKPHFRLRAMASGHKDTKFERAHTRKVLLEGKSLKGFDMPDERLCEKWVPFLDYHISSERPGRAIALLDANCMLETHKVRITSGGNGEKAAPSSPRDLSDAEVCTIGTWLEQHRASTPTNVAELRATEELWRASTVDAGWSLAGFLVESRESLGPSSAPGILQLRRGSIPDPFRTPTRWCRYSEHCIRPIP